MKFRVAVERAWDAYINMLAKALEDPASVDSSKNHNGYVCLSGENALLAADDMTTLRPAGHVCRAIDHDRLVGLLRQHGRCT